MTNIVFIEHKKVPKDQARAIKEDLKAYAISIALKFPATTISQEEKVRMAKSSVRTLLKQFDLSTKNLGTIIHDEVISNLQKLYFKLRKKSNYDFLLEMVQVIRFLRRNHPRKYRRIHKSLQRQLNNRQKLILSLYLNPKVKGKKRLPTYQTIGKIIKSTPGPISGEVKKMVKSINRVFKAQKIGK
jgi:hypothetical protein